MNNVLKIFAILVTLTTGCSSRQQSQLPTNTPSDSQPVAQQVQTISTHQINIPVPSNQWLVVTKTPDGSIVSVDTGSLIKTNDTVSFWSQINYAVPPNSGIAISRSYAVANCSNGNYRLSWIAAIGVQGQVLQNDKVEITSNAVPRSVPGITLQYACTRVLQPQAAQAQITQAQLETLTRRSQVSAKVINEAMRSAASLFK